MPSLDGELSSFVADRLVWIALRRWSCALRPLTPNPMRTMALLTAVAMLIVTAAAHELSIEPDALQPALATVGFLANASGALGGCPHACSGHGKCVDGECHCSPGWLGNRCERLDLLPSPAGGGLRLPFGSPSQQV